MAAPSSIFPPLRPASRNLARKLAQIQIVIADDDFMIATLVRDVLKVVGFTNIFIARDGKEALELIQVCKADLLITDWQLDRLDGVQLMRFLRGNNDSPNRFLPIIMLTGRAERRDVQVARDAGATEYLIKPFTAKKLFERIVEVVENPRSFVMANGFKGPDRRRRQIDQAPSEERRTRRVKPKNRPVAQ